MSALGKNPSARRARRNISKKLRTMESNRAARTMFDTLLENCIFYIAQLYEFSHRLGQSRSFGGVCSMSALLTGSRHNDRQAPRPIVRWHRTRELREVLRGCPSNSWATVTCSNFEGLPFAHG